MNFISYFCSRNMQYWRNASKSWQFPPKKLSLRRMSCLCQVSTWNLFIFMCPMTEASRTMRTKNVIFSNELYEYQLWLCSSVNDCYILGRTVLPKSNILAWNLLIEVFSARIKVYWNRNQWGYLVRQVYTSAANHDIGDSNEEVNFKFKGAIKIISARFFCFVLFLFFLNTFHCYLLWNDHF